MFRLSLKMTLARKGRLLLTSLAIILGTSFLSGTAIFSATINNTFDQLFTDVFRDVDAVVRSTSFIDTGFGKQRAPSPISVVDIILKVPGVKAAVGDVQSYARVIGKDGKPIGQDQGPPTFGGIISGSTAAIWKVDSGRFPIGPREMILDGATADAGKFVLGDTVRVNALSGTREFSLVGIATYGEFSSPGGATFALFDQPTASAFLSKPGFVDAFVIQGDGSLADDELAKAIDSFLPVEAKLETLTGAEISKEAASEIKTVLSFFTTFLTAFSLIALGIGCFVIYNVFSITAAQRQRESALLRAIGASRRQVTTSLMIEAVIIGLLGSIIGFLAGIGLSQALSGFLKALGIEIPTTGLKISTDALTSTILVGTIITILSAILPALRSGRVPPLAAMRETALDPVTRLGRRILIGILTFIGGSIALVLAANGARIIVLGIGVVAVFAGVLILGPAISKPVANLLGKPVAKLRGVTGAMSRQNAARNPKRTARTAAPVLIGVALVTAFTALAASIKSEIRETIGNSFHGDFALSVESRGFGGIPPSVTDKISQLSEVEQATGVGFLAAKVGDESPFVLVFNPKTSEGLFDIEIVDGRKSNFEPNEILVESEKAREKHLSVGSTVPVTLIDGRSMELKVAGTYQSEFSKYAVSRELFEGSTTPLFDSFVYIKSSDGIDDESARRAIAAVSSDLGIGTLESRDDYIDAQAAQVDQFLALIYGLLFLSVFIAIMGIVITLLLSVFERKHEIGLLRAVGMTRSQVRAMIRWESVITSLFGAVTGVSLGILTGIAIVISLNESGIRGFTLPIASTGYILIGSFIVGVIAAVFPAWRATRTEIISAIAST